jgi:hypothetical protein
MISLARSRAMSAEPMLPIEQSASPTTYGFLCFRSLQWFENGQVRKRLQGPGSLGGEVAGTVLGVGRQGGGWVLFERVCDEHEDILSLVQEKHQAQVSDPLLGEPRRGAQLHAFHLAEMGGVAEHVDVQQFGDAPVTQARVH